MNDETEWTLLSLRQCSMGSRPPAVGGHLVSIERETRTESDGFDEARSFCTSPLAGVPERVPWHYANTLAFLVKRVAICDLVSG